MNKLLIGQGRPQNLDKATFYISLANSSQMLGILRSDHFVQCQIQLPKQTTNSQLRFLMHTTRILTKQGRLLVKGTNQGISKVKNIIKNLGLFIVNQSQTQVQFSKNQPKIAEPQIKQQVKLPIGFKNLEEQQIDEDELLKNQNIDLTKASGGGCAQKPRACANCTCGRKEMEQNISKQQLLKSINEGQPVSGCGKCYLGDSFRCATCPYKGLPAFKPGDKLKLVDDTKVVVQSGATVVSNGKVKIQL